MNETTSLVLPRGETSATVWTRAPPINFIEIGEELLLPFCFFVNLFRVLRGTTIEGGRVLEFLGFGDGHGES